MLVAATMLIKEVHLGMAADCDSKKLEPCDPFFESRAAPPKPDSECCKNIKEEDGCYCEFLKDAKYCKLLTSPQAKIVGDAWGVPTPDPSTCPESTACVQSRV